MLSHVPRSRFIDPGRPPAADGGLRSQYPDLVLGAQQPLDCRQLRQAGRRVLTRSFDTRSKVSIDLVAVAIKPGSSEPQLTTSGRATYTIRFPLTKSQQNVTGCKPDGFGVPGLILNPDPICGKYVPRDLWDPEP